MSSLARQRPEPPRAKTRRLAQRRLLARSFADARPAVRAVRATTHPLMRKGYGRHSAWALVSVAMHGLAVIAVLKRPASTPPPPAKTVTVRVVTPPPEPAPEPEAPPPVEVARPTPRRAKPAAEQPAAVAAETPREPTPMPVLGISFESTVGVGSGPSVAVGNAAHGRRGPPSQAPTVAEPAGDGPGVQVTRPKRRVAIEPEYPAALRPQGVEGDVMVRLQLDATGAVLNASIVKASPYPELNAAALATASREQFAPGERDGVAVPFTITFTYRFRVDR